MVSDRTEEIQEKLKGMSLAREQDWSIIKSRREQSFHGRTLATLTATRQEKEKDGYIPLPEGFVHARFNDIQSVRNRITQKKQSKFYVMC